MSFANLKERISRIGKRIIEAYSKISSVRSQLKEPIKDKGSLKRKPELFAYHFFGRKTDHALPLFRDMDTGLRKSGLKISFKTYVSLTILVSLAAAVSTILIVPLLFHLLLRIALFPSLLFGIGFGLLAGALTIIFFYIYPLYRADNTKRNLDNTMDFTTAYLAILAGASIPPDRMFRSLSNIPQKLAIVDEARTIVRDVELFGADIITALENASKRAPSERFKELLEGFISTIHSGGNLMSYLIERSQENMSLKHILLKKFADTLGVLSEFYVTILIAGPLIFIVMFAVMAMLGGNGLGILDPSLLLMLLTYIGIPVGSVAFVVILDALSPRW
ncbi:MAG: type II secretion system F family protein [Candidatus Bathyarchaeota archaeon]|nr:MAG: type II secretion system F family protein [Candidatus Bathyarchaeota archaeon]